MKHRDQVLALLKTQIDSENEVKDIEKTAVEVAQKWVKPLSGGKEETNGLVYGLVQSGKTGVLTVTGAIGADEGYKTVIVLTSDNDALYNQTLDRVKEAFPGIDILGKSDFKDRDSFLQRIKGGTCAIVTTKNGHLLRALIENFQGGNVRGLACLVIDDEADQASLNTYAARDDGSLSRINEKISDLRAFFDKNTYLQVTATPQALFLQPVAHAFRPKFTVLSHPGHDYVGGDDFFADNSKLVKEFDPNDLTVVAPGPQPSPRLEIPKSLLMALDTFMVGATYKRAKEADQNCAFLCHVSAGKNDHRHIVDLFRKYKSDLATDLRARTPSTVKRLKAAFDDLSSTHEGIRTSNFDSLLDAIQFFSPGITVKLVNGDTDEDVAVKSPYNLFVGGNKLGRGVTIKNLLVSYYGRHPRRPQADTVLQHARMYGYRRKDIGLLRLFLPPALHVVFKAIHKMERSLRELIVTKSSEEFRGIFLENGLSPTRRNILAPGSLGIYAAGNNFNPAQIVRDNSVKLSTEKLDKLLDKIPNKGVVEMPIDKIQELLKAVKIDESQSENVWNTTAIVESLGQYAKLYNHKTGFVFVDRERGIEKSRRETQGILAGGEFTSIQSDKIALYMLRTKAARGETPAWWPQVRFPDGSYAFAFAV
jgi:hypothetical protein